MKHWPLILFFSLILLGCSKDKLNKKFTLSLFHQFSTPAGMSPLDAHYFTLTDIQTNFQNTIADLDIPDPSKITLVPEICILSPILGSPDFAFVREVSLKIYNKNNPVNKPEAFYLTRLPNQSVGELLLIPTEFEAEPFLNKGIINAEVKFLLYSTSPEPIDYMVRIDFRGNY